MSCGGETVRVFICTLLLGPLCCLTAKQSHPMVDVYTQYPEEYGSPNTFVCHVTGFYPPQIDIKLLKNGEEIPNAKQTDLAFEDNWHYYLTKYVPFNPNEADKFTCRVTHIGKSNEHSLILGL